MTESQINAALAKLQKDLPRITKDLTAKVQTKTGGNYTYSYADLSLISREVLPLLSDNGLAFTSRPTMVGDKFVLAYELRHVSGEQIDGVYPLPERGTPQEVGSAITYARRYSLCAVTGVAPDDEDHDAIVAEKAAKRERIGNQRQRKAEAPKVPPMDSGQQVRMQQLFIEVGLTDREGKLEYAVEAVGRKLGSASELTHEEASKVIEKLERWAEQSQPPAAGEAE